MPITTPGTMAAGLGGCLAERPAAWPLGPKPAAADQGEGSSRGVRPEAISFEERGDRVAEVAVGLDVLPGEPVVLFEVEAVAVLEQIGVGAAQRADLVLRPLLEGVLLEVGLRSPAHLGDVEGDAVVVGDGHV